MTVLSKPRKTPTEDVNVPGLVAPITTGSAVSKPSVKPKSNNINMPKPNSTYSVSHVSDSVRECRDFICVALPESDPRRTFALHNLGSALLEGLKQHTNLELLDQCISTYRTALSHLPDEAEKMGLRLKLADALIIRSEQSIDIDFLSEAIETYQMALSSNLFPGYLLHEIISALGIAMQRKFEHFGDEAALTEAVTHHTECLNMCSGDHPYRSRALTELSSALMLHFSINGDMSLLLKALSYLEEALEISTDSSVRSQSLHQLGNVLYEQCRHNPKHTDSLARSINLFRAALRLLPDLHPRRPLVLGDLAKSLFLSFEHHACAKDKDEALELYQEAFRLLPYGHPCTLVITYNYSSLLLLDAANVGDVDQLTYAISICRSVLRVHPPNHPYRIATLATLGRMLEPYFLFTGDTNAPGEMVNIYEQVLSGSPPSSVSRARAYTNLGVAQILFASVFQDRDMLAASIHHLRSAMVLIPSENPNLRHPMVNLGRALLDWFKQSGDQDALSESIQLLKRAWEMYATQLGDHGRYTVWRPLIEAGIAYQKCTGNTSLVRELPEMIEGACKDETISVNNRNQLHYLLARLHVAQSSWELAFKHFNSANDKLLPRLQLEEAGEVALAFDQALENGPPNPVLAARVLDAYLTIMHVIPKAVHFGLSIGTRLRALSRTGLFCRTAAVRAFLINRFSVGTEILEAGRSVFWAQALRMRSNLDLLFPEEKDELLHHFKFLEEESQREVPTDRVEAERRTVESWRINSRIEEIIKQVRARPGLEHFLQSPSFGSLTSSAAQGIVVQLAATEVGCFAAVIVNSDGNTRLLHLPDVTLEKMKNLQMRVASSGLRNVTSTTENSMESREARLKMTAHSHKSAPSETRTSLDVLEEIWTQIVHPIVENLNLQKRIGSERPRVYWCPSGDLVFLPLHAAGIYTGENKACTSDYFVSSYTPSLSILMKSQKDLAPIPRKAIKALVISEPHPPGFAPLARAEEEATLVSNLVRTANAAVLERSQDAPMVPFVVENLKDAHLLHFACHGYQDSNPLKSYFALQNGRLSIEQLMKLDLPQASLAFLSACETAKGDKQYPDQAVHLASSMLFCGFRSVIATMWSMGDADGPVVAKMVYEYLLRGEHLNLNDVPYALDAAVQTLRAKGLPPSRWATFIHLGA